MFLTAKLQKKIETTKYFYINILQYKYFFIPLHRNIDII